jgi:hypothetical protein|tara:strand:+ start:671 stop:1060 length:390 start_codon:yes stop_codon:yes gene_type:complete
MNNHKRRPFRPRTNKNSFRGRSNGTRSGGNGHFQNNNGNNNFSRNGSMTNPFSVEKTMQKYQQLAKDAQSLGDPVLVENYLQHADHYCRRLTELNVRVKSPAVNQEPEKENKVNDASDNSEKVIEKEKQ